MTRPHGRTEFALRLTRFREARQLSQKQLAISKYESGQRMPRTPEMWIRLSAALTVSPAELLGLPPWNGPLEDPRLAVRLRELSGRLASDPVPALLALLDAALALTDGDQER